MDTKTYEDCRVEDADDGTVLKWAVVTVNGDSASIHQWDTETNRPEHYDRLTGADIKAAGKGVLILTGVSQRLVRTMGVPKDKAVVHLKVQPGKGSLG